MYEKYIRLIEKLLEYIDKKQNVFEYSVVKIKKKIIIPVMSRIL